MLYRITWAANIGGTIEIDSPTEADALAEFRQMRVYEDEVTGEDANIYSVENMGGYEWEAD